MRGGPLLSVLLAWSKISTLRAISLEKCSYRMTNIQHADDAFKLAIFDCDFDEELYMKSRLDSDLGPIISTATKENVAAAIANSAEISNIPWANFAGLTVVHDMAVPNSLFSYSHNVKLGCKHDNVDFELFQKPSHEAPIDFLYSLPPMKNSINELLQGFGAYKWPENPISRRMSFAVMVDAGAITKADLESCIDQGKLIVSTDNSPLEACEDCEFVPLSSGCSEDECSIWQYSDRLGNGVDPSSSISVVYSDNQCDLDAFTNFVNERLPQLYELLETAKTEEESNAAILSYATVVNNVEYAKCKNTFDSLYTTKSASVFLKGVKACEDPTNDMDPCCNEELKWGDCCLPEDKNIEIEGVFNSSNPNVIDTVCGTNANAVKELLDSEFSQVLISVSHPEFGCEAKYETLIPKHDQDIFESLWGSVNTCETEVRWGETKAGGESCTSNDECWSGSCINEDVHKRCTPLHGEAIAGPLLSCVVSKVDKKLWKHMANVIDVDPAKIKKDGTYTDNEWSDAVVKFKRLVGSPNCVGEDVDSGICAIIDITKAECLSINYIYDWSRQMEWVVDETNINGGFCKKRYSYWEGAHIHGYTENVQEECEMIISGMQGACVDSTTPNGIESWGRDEAECIGPNETWFSFISHEVRGYRLKSRKIYLKDEETGNWIESFEKGDERLCVLESKCNWDPDSRFTSGDEDLCLDPSSLANTTYPRGNFKENGKNMACLQCWGSRCEEFYHSSPPICAVSPFNVDHCAANSGGGPNNDSPVSAILNIKDDESHLQCRRNILQTESECLPIDFCPILSSKENHYDEWEWRCAESSCWDLSKNELSCHYNESTKISYGWHSEWRAGEGACRVEYDVDEEKSFDEKGHCESKGPFLWWEGRGFKPGKFNSAEECSSFCNDGTWPIKQTCSSSGSCNEHCEQCVVGNSWRFPDGAACYLNGSITEYDCHSDLLSTNYEWHWESQLCHRKDFSGTEADCVDLDMSSDASKNLTHQYISCSAQTSSGTCTAYCWAKDYDEYTTCQTAGLDWDWSSSRCKHPTWTVNQATHPTCESFVAHLDANSTEHERWFAAKDCWSNGCSFELGSIGYNAAICAGAPKGCSEQEGHNEWVDGGDDSTATAKMSLLECHWDEWRKCSTKDTCLDAGECDDWFIEHGKCIVPLEPNEWGDRKGCDNVKNPFDGTNYTWGGKMGCVARKTVDAVATYLKESECNSVGGTWHVRAKTQDDCEDNRDMVCSHPFDEWSIFGGIKSEAKCDTCGYKSTPPTKWRKGVWSPSAETPLYWTDRAFSTKNKWEEQSFDESAYHDLVKNSISRYIAEAFKSKVYCELGAYEAWIPAIISMCGTSGNFSEGETNVVSYDLSTVKVACGDLQNQPPLETFEGSIDYKNATCATGENKFADTTLGKVVPLAAKQRVGTGRRISSESVCAAHALIKNSNNAYIGQKLGSGLTVTGINGATVCINPTVPSSEICSNYVEFGIVTINSNGSYSVPTDSNVTINSKGEICFDGSESGSTYVPVKLESAWETKSGPITQAPSISPEVVLDSAPTSIPSIADLNATSPSIIDKGGNTADDSIATNIKVSFVRSIVSIILVVFGLLLE